MTIALRISVDSYRATLQGLPRLVDVLRRHQARATFLFNVGPDRSGHALLGPLRRHRALGAHSALTAYGFKALCYGTIWPGPDIGRRCADMMRATQGAGHECALHCWDRSAWLAQAAGADAEWTEIELRKGVVRFAEIFGADPAGHGAAAWLMNRHSLRMTQRMGLRWSSDTRGHRPFLPIWNGEPVNCPQLPTTLPTLAELKAVGTTNEASLPAELQRLAGAMDQVHVFSACAEADGVVDLEQFELAVGAWRAAGHELVSLGELRATLDPLSLPRHEVLFAPCPGRVGMVLTQGPEFLSPAESKQ